MGHILVVEDESAIAELISMNLRHAGFEVLVAPTPEQAQLEVSRMLPDLILLDWMLPGQSGLSLTKRWRAEPRTRALPIIMLTAHADEANKVAGLNTGADDYLTKPFSPQELLARIRAVLRRKAPETLDAAVELGPLNIDPSTRRVTSGRTEIKLGATEFKLLYFFMTHPERVHSRAHVLNRVWGDHVFIEERTVDVHIKRLRAALGASGCAHLIDTVRGAGYRLTLQGASPSSSSAPEVTTGPAS
jgi:two-component system, OmpR family, phosphate regulon response regulator PhoB